MAGLVQTVVGARRLLLLLLLLLLSPACRVLVRDRGDGVWTQLVLVLMPVLAVAFGLRVFASQKKAAAHSTNQPTNTRLRAARSRFGCCGGVGWYGSIR